MSTPARTRAGRIRLHTPKKMLSSHVEYAGSLSRSPSVSRRGSQTSANSKASMGLDDIFVQMACPKFLDKLENADAHTKRNQLRVPKIREWTLDDENDCSGAHEPSDIEAMYEALGTIRNTSVTCLEDNPVTPAEVTTQGWKSRPEVTTDSAASTPAVAPNTARRRKKNNAARGRRRIDWKPRKAPAAPTTSPSDTANVSLDAIKNLIQHSVKHTLQHTARAHYHRTLTPPRARYSRSACSFGSRRSGSSSCFTPRSYNTAQMACSKRAYRNDDSFATTAVPNHATSTNSSAFLDTDSLCAHQHRHRCAASHGTERHCDHDGSESAISCHTSGTHHHHENMHHVNHDHGIQRDHQHYADHSSRRQHDAQDSECRAKHRGSITSSRTEGRAKHRDRDRPPQCHHGDRDGANAVSSRHRGARCYYGTEPIKHWDTDSGQRDTCAHHVRALDTDGADSVASSRYVSTRLMNTPRESRRSTMESVDHHASFCHAQNQPTDRSRDTEQHLTPRRTSLSSACTTIPRTSEHQTLLEPRVPRLRLDQLQSLLSPPAGAIRDLSPVQSCCSEQVHACVLEPTPRVRKESLFALQATPRVAKECIVPSRAENVAPDSATCGQHAPSLEPLKSGGKETLTSVSQSSYEVAKGSEDKVDTEKDKENIPRVLSSTRMPQRFMSEPSITFGDNPRRFRQSVFGFRQRAKRMGARLSRMFVHKEGLDEMHGTMEISNESWRNLCTSSFALHDIAE